MRTPLLAIALIITSPFAGCVADHSFEEWKRGKLSEELSKLDPIRGTFRGVLKTSQDGEDLGALELSFSPQIKVVPGGASERADGRPVLNARLRFEDRDTRLAASVSDSYFDSDTGRFQLTLLITRAGGRSEELTLGGILNRDQIAGEMRIAGSPTAAGTFSLSRSASSGSLSEIAQKLTTKPWFSAPSSARNGITRFSSGQIRNSRIVILEPETTPEESFLNRFAPVRVVQFTLNYGDSVKLVNDAAVWDERTRKLTGRALLGAAGNGGPSTALEVLTECTSTDSSDPLGSWSCTHEVPGVGRTATSEFSSGQTTDDEPSDVRASTEWSRSGSILTSANRTSSVWMKLQRPARTRAEDISSQFNPTSEKLLTLTLQFGLPESTEAERVTVVFENARYDQILRTMDAKTQLRALNGGASALIEVTLRCTQVQLDGLSPPSTVPLRASCDYSSTQLTSPLRLNF